MVFMKNNFNRRHMCRSGWHPAIVAPLQINQNKKDLLSQGNRAMLQLFFSV